MSTLNWSQQFNLAVRDVVGGLVGWRFWLMLGWHEIKQRYRRSTLGALWVTLNMAVTALIMGYLLGFLFSQRMGKYLPYVCLSLALWGYITASISECAGVFFGNASTIMQIKRPYMMYIMHAIWKNIIIFIHTIVIFFVVAPLNDLYPSMEYFLFIPGFFLVTLNISWISLMAGILSARFRDVPLIIQNLFAALMWLTPVLYLPSQLTGRREILLWINPFAYLMEVMRSPLMGDPIPMRSWIVVAVMGIVGWGIALLLFTRTRHRIAYWL